jgi:hypothetical protein
MAYPVHGPGWDRPGASRDYLVTTTFDGIDLVNGGLHRAVDLGNFLTGDPIRTPAPCRVMGKLHIDGAWGVILDLGGGWVLAVWHLEVILVPRDRWTTLGAGVEIGRTGRSGRVRGAHTHTELEKDGRRVDPQPFLTGLATLMILEDADVELPVADYLAHGTVNPGVNLREPAPRGQPAGSGQAAGQFDSPTGVAILYRAANGKPYTIEVNGVPRSSTAWYGVKLPGPDYREVAALLVTNIRPAPVLGELLPDLDGGRALRERIARASSQLAAAVGPQSAVTTRLAAARQELEL